MKIHQVNAETGTEITRDATPDEIAEIKKTQAEAQEAKATFLTENEKNAALKSSAVSKLIELGLSKAEAQAFLS